MRPFVQTTVPADGSELLCGDASADGSIQARRIGVYGVPMYIECTMFGDLKHGTVSRDGLEPRRHKERGNALRRLQGNVRDRRLAAERSVLLGMPEERRSGTDPGEVASVKTIASDNGLCGVWGTPVSGGINQVGSEDHARVRLE